MSSSSSRLFCGTWNVNGQQPMQRMDKFILSDSEAADIVAIGCVGFASERHFSVGPLCVAVCLFALRFPRSFQELDMSTEAFVRNESAREELWLDLVESSLSMVEKKYKRVREKHL